ncbi:Putative 5-formyltetrahydrofolate cyclo-ligase [Candidatus Bealeia paramacronuclearis]|uniref:5-formyltetrahydrofolate cyclo-ligase n=1 Tax=Candidatus Bealeia paramacronuclearis TaxID=1921001 RepID=A0ABZ2C235_9PROT|nr:putative 5-formyltetrahydrofolate cyclo-ligase [Candidatus Bealeia paramacronuclearis]
MSLIHAKQKLRQEMKALRLKLAPTLPEASNLARNVFLKSFPNTLNVALYYPLKEELDTKPLLESLREKGSVISLPVITDHHLIFKKWDPKIALIKSSFQTFEPNSSSEIILPEIIVVPLLAFDRKGHRLGYGKGHFDRTLNAFRQNHKIIAIGYAYSFQELQNLPQEDCDERLDYIITEKEIISILS